MKDITKALMQQFRREHKAARRYMALLLALALLTSLFVNWQLHSVGIAQTADYQCGEIEHQHTAECYEKVLVCGYEEDEPEDWNATKPDDSAFPDADYGVEQSDADIAAYSAEPEPEYIFVPHQHTDDCYQEVKTLTCYQEEHVHTDDCFDPEDGSLICDLFEHTHDDSCYTIEYELVCGLEEGELVEEPNPDYVPVDEEASAVFDDAVALQPVVDDSSLDTPVHHHTDACYEEVLVCGLPEHHHTVNCLSDPLADVEDEETWSAKTNVSLTGAWADDLTAVAKSQLGYQQSERNFQLDDEDQTTVRHYTRYGAWYGNAYGAWDVMFLSYCLNYANVPQTTVPQRAGVQALRSDLRGSEWLKVAAEVELVPGDIVFYNSITTETVAVEEDAPQIMDDSADADIALLSLEPAAAEPQTEERTVSTETVGIVSDVDADTGTLTVISGDVDGKVAEVSLRADEITDVIDLAAADKAQEDGEREDTDGVEPAGDEETSLVIWATGPVSRVSPYAAALLSDEAADDVSTAAETEQTLNDHITRIKFQKETGTGSNTKWTDPCIISKDGAVLEFEALPELKKGEKYILYYATKAADEELKDACKNNRSSIMYNEATAKTDKVEVSSGQKQITYFCDIIKKTGGLNADGLIEWTVVVHAPLDGSTNFLKDYKFQDVLPKNIKLSGEINVQIEGEHTTNEKITLEQMEEGVKLSELSDNAKTAYRFTITYKTTVPTDGSTSVKNVANLDNKILAEKTVPISQGVWTLTKTHSRTDNNNIAYWNLSAVNATGADHFELTDTIGNTTDDSDRHYAIASELQKAIEDGLTLYLTGSNSTLDYAQAEEYLTITYFDASNNKVKANDDNTPVLSFTVAVKKAEDGNSIAVRQMVLNDVPTHEERIGKPEGTDWTFTNNAKITQDGIIKATDSAEDVYRSSVFEKSVAIDDKRRDYITGDTTVNYNEVKDQKLLYRIKLVTTGTETGEIVIEDALPDGTKLTVSGDKLKLFVDNKQYGWYEQSRWGMDRYDEKTNKLIVHVYDCHDGKQHVIELLYEVSFKGDSRWKDLYTSDVTYENSAKLRGSDKPAVIKTTVHKDIAPLIKTGKQLKDEKGNWTNTITYKVIINPAAQKLGTTGTLKLKDKADIIRGSSFYGHNVRLYRYDRNVDESNLEQVKEGLYHIEDPEDGYWLCMTVPDGVALLLQYDIEFDPGDWGSPKLSNTVQLEGIAYSPKENVDFQKNESDVHISRGQLVIHKMDAETSKFLPGAEFTIDRYNKNSGAFEYFMSDTTDANGELTFSITSADQTLSPNVLYRLTETKAPDNYILDSTPKYLFFYEKGADDKDADPKEAFKKALGDTPITDKGQPVTADNVIFGCSTKTTQLTVKNTYNKLTVQKYWLSATDSKPLVDADIPVDSIQVQLYRYTEGQKATDAVLVDTQKLNKDNWSYTWAGENEIPAADRDGNKYYYLVKEVTTGNWVTEITNNDGIQTGKIFIINKVYSGYELPSTGGMGTVPFAAVGGMLTVGAALLLAKRKKHEEKGE